MAERADTSEAIRPVEIVAAGLLVTADGRHVYAASEYTSGAMTTDGRPIRAVSVDPLVAADGGPIRPLDLYTAGTLVTPDGRPVEAVEFFNKAGAATPTAPTGSTTDASWANVSLLVGFTGGVLADESSNAVALTAGTGSVSSTFGKFGSNSWQYDGAARISGFWAEDNALFEFGAGAFTLEGFWNFGGNDFPSTGVYLFCKTASAINRRSYYLKVSGSPSPAGTLELGMSSSGSSYTLLTSAAGAVTSDTAWHHIAVDGDGTTVRVYVDGVVVASGAQIALKDSITGLGIGGDVYSGTLGTGIASAFMDEIRITKGVARYAAALGFSPPAAAFPRSG